MLKNNNLLGAGSHNKNCILSIAFALSCCFLVAQPGHAQVNEARQAMVEGDSLRAIQILSSTLNQNQTAEVQFYLGRAHANLKQYEKALAIFKQASQRYPNDSRFHSETASIHLINRDVEEAKDSLHTALALSATDPLAVDLLASIKLDEGNTEGALQTWNLLNQPTIDKILQNFSPGFINWVVPQSLAFSEGKVLDYDLWRTTQERLYSTGLFTNVNLDIEPSYSSNLYNASIQTNSKNNGLGALAVGFLRGLPVETTYLDIWNVGLSGITFRASYRWDEDRRRLRGQLLIPIPIPGVPVLEFTNTWRSERWNVSESIKQEFRPNSRFDYKTNSLRLGIHAVPHYKFEIGGRLDYRNRAASGKLAKLYLNHQNSATFTVDARIRTIEGRFSNQLRFEAFVARKGIWGDFDFSGVSAQIANRYGLDEELDTFLDWSLSGGTARGHLPLENYFMLGIGRESKHPLRGHFASNSGQYGRAPMGTDFVLLNTEIQRKLITIPMFNAFGIPYVSIKAAGFYDAAKVFDRNRVFKQGNWLNDVGLGMRFETPTGSFSLMYGRGLTEGINSFYGYVERRFW